MSYMPTAAERALTAPGICTRCGADAPYGRNTAGECTDCHNLGVAEYREKRKMWREEQRAVGRAYWTERGVKVGQRVVHHALGPFGLGDLSITGIAKVGVVGAYVYVKGEGQLDPNYFQAEKQPEP